MYAWAIDLVKYLPRSILSVLTIINMFNMYTHLLLN